MAKFGSEVRSPCFFGHLVPYLIIAITPRRMYRLGSVDTIRHHLEALSFVTFRDKISVLNSASNVDSEYVYFI